MRNTHILAGTAVLAFSTYCGAVLADTPISSPIEFALQSLNEACAPYMKAAAKSLEDADLALYCLSTGESIVLSTSHSLKDKQYAHEIIARWIESVQPSLAVAQ